MSSRGGRESLSFKKDILQKVVLLTSKDPFRVKKMTYQVAKRIAATPGLDLNFEEIDARTDDLESALSRLQTIPFGAEKRILLVREAQFLTSRDVKKIEDYLQHPVETSSLILSGTGIGKRDRLYKLVEANGRVIEQPKHSRREYPSLIKSLFREKGKTISNRALAFLLESIGYDLEGLYSAIEKIDLCYDSKVRIDLEDVALLISPTVEHTVYELVDQIALRNLDTSLKLFYSLLKHGEKELDIFYRLVRQYRLLLLYQALAGDKEKAERVAQYLKVEPFVVEKLREQSRKYEISDLKTIYRRLLEFDVASKSSESAANSSLEMLIYDICRPRPD